MNQFEKMTVLSRLAKTLTLLFMAMLAVAPANAQSPVVRRELPRPVLLEEDSLRTARMDSIYRSLNDTAAWEKELEFVRGLDFDPPSGNATEGTATSEGNGKQRLKWKDKEDMAVREIEEKVTVWEPEPKKAVLFSIVPGGGQIYNKKYWKLPVVYGGFVGCVYALTWNQSTYTDYRKAYVDIMDSDPDTRSYEDFLPPHYEIDTSMEDWLKDVFKNRKNKYRRQRDLSIFAFVGMYVLSAIDAYVDAELYHFDISPDLSLQWQPQIDIERGVGTAGLALALHF
ncbi:MAG: DUF5683 domain-containing protein [Bacteroidaceae bacterium]|nr:DUF5683 domain-containing protein [Bacteroidaceae bacterium]